MIENSGDRKLGYFLAAASKYAILPILSPLFFLLAIMYVCLHPKR
jgi:hypothetical protein